MYCTDAGVIRRINWGSNFDVIFIGTSKTDEEKVKCVGVASGSGTRLIISRYDDIVEALFLFKSPQS